jgi:5-keto 4-deoxyuronate isomerase
MIFTDGNILSVYTEGIMVGKKELKQSQKNTMTCHLYQRNDRRNEVGIFYYVYFLFVKH